MSDSGPLNSSGSNPQHNREATSDSLSKEFRLGVLLVHGIGTQPPRDTLVRWGDVLVKAIGRATQNEVNPVASRASPGDRSGDKPAEAVLQLCADRPDEKWLLAEGWWADSFPAPTYAELVSWSIGALPWSGTLHIAQQYWQVQTDPAASSSVKRLSVVRTIIQLLVALALAPIVVTLLVATLLLGVLPIPQLRSLLLSAQSLLTRTVGDSLAFVESPLRAALIRTRILDGLERLQSRCDRTVIIAHSQGAAATLDALGGITVAGGPARAVNEGQRLDPPVPDSLVTYGSGVNQLVSLKVLSSGLPESLTWISMNPASFGVGAVLVMSAMFLFLYASIRFGQMTVLGVLQAAVLFVGILTSMSLLVWGAERIVKRRIPTLNTTTVVVWMSVSLMLAAVGVLLFVGLKYDLPIGSISFFFYFLAPIAASVQMILSPTMRTLVASPVRWPRGLRCWVDLYASRDPVPNGRTRTEDVEPMPRTMNSVPVWNRGSILSDHTTYWENLDGFVLQVVRVLAETARSPWADKLPAVTCYSDRRAAWRVGVLRWARRLNTVLWLAIFVLLWARYRASVPLPVELPIWAPLAAQTAERAGVLAAVVGAGAWATAALIRWPWSSWVRGEQEQVLAHIAPIGTPWARLIMMGMVVALVAVSVKAIGEGDMLTSEGLLARTENLLDIPGEIFGWLVPGFWGGVLFAWLAHRARPGTGSPMGLTGSASRTPHGAG